MENFARWSPFVSQRRGRIGDRVDLEIFVVGRADSRLDAVIGEQASDDERFNPSIAQGTLEISSFKDTETMFLDHEIILSFFENVRDLRREFYS